MEECATPMARDTAYSTKDDKQDLRVQGRAHVPNIYMKFNDPFPSARAFKTCSVAPATKYANTSHKVQMQKLSTLLALTALTCQPKNQCRITVSVSLRQTPFSFLHTLYCLQCMGPLSSTQLTQIQQQLFHRNFLACSA